MSSALAFRDDTGTMFANTKVSVQNIHIFNEGGTDQTATVRDGSTGSDPVIFSVIVPAGELINIELPFGLGVSNGFHVTLDADIEISMVEGGIGGGYLRRTSSGVFLNAPAKVQGVILHTATGLGNKFVKLHDSSTSDNEKIEMRWVVDDSLYYHFYHPLRFHTQLFGEFSEITSATVFLA